MRIESEHVVQRYIDLHEALRKKRSFWEDTSHARYTAMVALDMEGSPHKIAEDIYNTKKTLTELAGSWSSMNGMIGYLIATLLLRAGDSPGAFLDASKRAGKLFRSHKVPRGSLYETFAILNLRHQNGNGEVTDAQVVRFRTILQEMKKHHPFLTGTDDYTSVALLVGEQGVPETIVSCIEDIYEALVEVGMKKRNPLQTAANMMFLARKSPAELAERFSSLHRTFRDYGVRIYTSDYDELAILSFLGLGADQIVNRVQSIRERLTSLRPRMDKDTHFSIASSLAFLEMAKLQANKVNDAKAMMDVQALIAAQQAAMVGVIVSSTVAVSAASSAG